MIMDSGDVSVKYSLKSKEFNKKRLNIFNRNQQRSRSRSASPAPNKNANTRDQFHIMKQFTVNVDTPASIEHSVVQKFNELLSHKNSFQIQSNEEERLLFESFAKVQHVNDKSQFTATNNHTLKPIEPLRIQNQQRNAMAFENKAMDNIERSENKSDSFQIREGSPEHPLRINKFFTDSILNKESQSPNNKVVFEPVIRKSMSPPAKSPSLNSSNQIVVMNRVQPINMKIMPESNVQPAVYSHPVERIVKIVQIPRQNINAESSQISLGSPPMLSHHQMHKMRQQNQEVINLKKKIQEQNLQIQYLKNQKQILESNMQLQFSPKKGYQTNRFDQQTYQTITPQKYGQSVQLQQNQLSQIDKNKMLQLAEILSNNHLKLTIMENKFQKIYSTIFDQFNSSLNKCQNLLIQLFSQKYHVFSEQLKARLNIFDKKSQQISQLQQKIDIFTNTFRNIEENLRITKLKQQNIELLIKNKNKQKQSFLSKDQASRILMMENQFDISSIKKYDDNEMEDKDREDLFRLQRNIGKTNVIPQWDQNSEDFKQFDSFLDDKYSHLVYKRQIQNSRSKSKGSSKSRKKRQKHFKNHNSRAKSPGKNNFIISQAFSQNQKRSVSEEIEQFSPFQANQMFKNQSIKTKNYHNNFMKHSQILPQKDNWQEKGKSDNKYFLNNKNKANLSFNDIQLSKDYDFNQDSFDAQMDFKPVLKNQVQRQISFNSQNMFKKLPSKTNTQNEEISDSLQGEQDRIVKILKGKKYQFPIDCWIDEMGCLRKKNQTYIFDEQGSVIITTSAAFQKLKEKRIFS